MASRGSIDLATLVLIYVMLGLGLNIVVGLAGLLDLGYVAFYAVGAYSYALLSQYFGLGFWQCLPIAGLLAGTFGFLLGFPVLRLQGDYPRYRHVGVWGNYPNPLNNLTELTGGPNGIGGIPKPSLPAIQTEPSFGLVGLEFSRRASRGIWPSMNISAPSPAVPKCYRKTIFHFVEHSRLSNDNTDKLTAIPD